MSASSQIPGNEASKGRLSYRGSYNLEDMNTYANGKKTFQTYTKKSSWDSAQKSCLAQPGGAGVLGTISNQDDQSKLETAIRPISNGVECWWIGLRRVNGQYQVSLELKILERVLKYNQSFFIEYADLLNTILVG